MFKNNECSHSQSNQTTRLAHVLKHSDWASKVLTTCKLCIHSQNCFPPKPSWEMFETNSLTDVGYLFSVQLLFISRWEWDEWDESSCLCISVIHHWWSAAIISQSRPWWNTATQLQQDHIHGLRQPGEMTNLLLNSSSEVLLTTNPPHPPKASS